MFGGIDPKKIAGMMSKMGITNKEIEASRVIIEQEDKNIVIENPQVTRIEMQGNTSFQISGDISEQEKLSDQDIKQVMEQTGVSREKAKKALEENNGDLAEAILSLS